MIVGRFGENGELFFEIEIVDANGENFLIEVLLDTDFTTGWLTMDIQDIQVLEWPMIESSQVMKTVRGYAVFRVYLGKVIVDRKDYTIPVIATTGINENLLGLQCLKIGQLAVNFSANVLTFQSLF